MKVNPSVLVFVFACVFVSVSCSRIERVATTKEQEPEVASQPYLSDEVSFSFPADWSVTKDALSDNKVRDINLEDKHYTRFKIAAAPIGSYHALGENVEKFKTDFRRNLKVGTVSDFEESFSVRENGGTRYEGKRLRFALSIFPEELTVAELFVIRQGKRTALITITYPEKDFVAADQEIQTIFETLKFGVEK